MRHAETWKLSDSLHDEVAMFRAAGLYTTALITITFKDLNNFLKTCCCHGHSNAGGVREGACGAASYRAFASTKIGRAPSTDDRGNPHFTATRGPSSRNSKCAANQHRLQIKPHELLRSARGSPGSTPSSNEANNMVSGAILSMDIAFCKGILLWPLLKSLYRIHVLLAYEE